MDSSPFFGMVRLGIVLGLSFARVATLSAQPAVLADAEALAPPTAQRLVAIHAAAQREGWASQAEPLRAAAMRAYEREKFAAAEAWLNVARWAALFGERETEYVPRWIRGVDAAKVGHANMTVPPDPVARPLSDRVAPPLQAWLIGDAAFSAEFFALLSPVDYLPRVLAILDELHRRDPARFRTHAQLALAIAVVYDVPPPPSWPHGQVTAAALPRQLPAPAQAFAWWVKQEQRGRLHHRLGQLGAGELKFVVDTVVPFAELEWAQDAANLPLSQLARAYTMVRYRTDRVTGEKPIWPGATYALQDILAEGGICPDQAFFATQVGKARGVPTLLIYGAGNDGRHAWFGYLDGGQVWQLDAGRYAEQRFVTGFARDPQTWREFSDHELKFLSERFRELPAFKQSRVHELFAATFLAAGNARAAALAARKAVNFERRNHSAWERLIAATRGEGRDQRTIENLLREAALAFQRYPDLEAYYANRVAESLRARGETSAADAEARRIATKYRDDRDDLRVQQALEMVQRAIATQPLAGQIRVYNSVVDTYGRGGGIGFFDAIVTPFAEHLVQLKQPAEALRAVERARLALKVEPHSQLASEFDQLASAVKRAR